MSIDDAAAALAEASVPEPGPTHTADDAAAAETPLTGPQADAAAAQLLRAFLAAHEARASHYTRLHEGFKAMLQSGQDAPFRELLMELTGRFNDVSKQVISIEHQLVQRLQRPQLAVPLRHVQEHERDKLRHTLTLQALRQAEARQGFSWQQAEHGIEGSGIVGKLSKAAVASTAPADAEQMPDQGSGEAGAAAARTGESCSHAHACCGGHAMEEASEPTEAEFRGAVEEASQLLNSTVEAINESIEEVRYALEDLADEAEGDA